MPPLSDPILTHLEPIEDTLSQPDHGATLEPSGTTNLLRLLGFAILISGLLMLAINALSGGGLRPAALFAVFSGALMIELVRRDRPTWAAALLCWSTIPASILGALSLNGLAAPAWAVIIIGTMAGGWLLGRKAALALALAGSASVLLVYSLQKLGLSFPQKAPDEVLLVGLLILVWLAGMIGQATARDFWGRHRALRASEARYRALSDDLGHQVDARADEIRAAQRALRQSEERFRRLFEDTHQPSVLYQDGHFIAVNRAALELMGTDRPEQVIGQTPSQFSPSRQPDGRPSTEKEAELIATALAQGSAGFEWELLRADGRPLLAQVLLTAIREQAHDQDQHQDLIHIVFTDITARRAAEAALVRSQAELEEAQALAHLGSWTLDFATQRMDWSREVFRISGLEPGGPIPPDYPFCLVHPEDATSFEAAWQATTLMGAPYDITHRIIVQGQVKWVHARAEVSFDADGQPRSAIGTLQDVTAQKQALDQMEYLAYNDPLTGLLNRAAGQERLQHDVATARRHFTSLALLYMDLDKFKFINDTYGHAIGDLLLQGVARRLLEGLRGADSVCRLSGDEFMALLTDLEPEHLVAQVSTTCERLLASLAEPFQLGDHQVNTSFSIGVAVYPHDGQDGEALMRNADTALYEAKKAGKNTYRFFEPRMNTALTRFVLTRDALRRALDRDEFELHYQPQIELATGRVKGVEALLRWRRPGLGLVMPDGFIAIAEESGLIHPIGRWVLREACRQLVAWQQAGIGDLALAVNLSAIQFRHAALANEVREALDASHLDPSRLELELTESVLLQSEAGVQTILAGWKDQGIHLAIDDFGTGCSSLAYLKRFRVDKLKIDRSFIQDLLSDADDQALVRAMIQLARGLRIRILAEGVETAHLAERLQVMDCDEAQGFLYARPLPPAELQAWLSDWPGQSAAIRRRMAVQ